MDDKLLEILHEFRDQHEMLAYRGAAGEADDEAIAAIKGVFLEMESMRNQEQKLEVDGYNDSDLTWCGTCDQILNDDGDCMCKRLNKLRQAIRKEVGE